MVNDIDFYGWWYTKIFSPSYDVVSFLVFSAFVVNLSDLVRIEKIRDVGLKKQSILFFLFAHSIL